MKKDTIYRDKAHGTIEHYTYSGGRRIFVSRSWSEKEVRRGYARYIDLWKPADQQVA